MSTSRRIIVVGGGAAGVFAAIACAEAAPDAEVIVLEKSAQFLAKVRISGGGRCNVTHACFDPREFARHYPRGEQALIGAFHQFQARHTVEWFESHGVKLKAERDGRMFPATDSSQTIVDCLLSEAKKTGVMLHANCGVDSIVRQTNGGFMVTAGQVASEKSSSGVLNAPQGLGVRQPSAALSAPEHQKRQRAAAVQNAGAPTRAILGGQAGNLVAENSPRLGSGEVESCPSRSFSCDRLLLATGGCRAAALGRIPVSLGHTLEPPVPSLFTFTIASPWLRSLAGVAVDAEVSVPGSNLSERGPVLVTHWGLSGPAILRFSAWGARKLHTLNYQFPLRVNWLPGLTSEAITRELQGKRASTGARLVVNTPVGSLTARLWEALVLAAGIPRETRWAALPRASQEQLAQQLARTELGVTGKSLNKDEFVTCGGVRLSEVNFKTMESRVCAGLHFAGELLDIDGLTGGFNFQAAWTTGWIAGRAMAAD